MLPCLLLILSLTCSSNGQSSGCSSTVTGGPREFVPCAFPFLFDGRTFNTCTSHLDGDNKLWCSTQTDSQGNHMGGSGNWGYCDQSCQEGVGSSQGRFTAATTRRPQFRVTTTRPEQRFDLDLPSNNNNDFQGSDPDESVHFGVPRDRPTTARTRPTFRATPRPTRRPTQRTTLRTTRKPVPLQTSGNGVSAKPGTPEAAIGNWIPSPDNDGCGFQTNVGFILGGSDASRGEFPGSALLGYTGFGDGRIYYLCGGSLINRRYVLTAAHCHGDEKVSDRIHEVVLGEYDVGQDPDCSGCFPAQKIRIGPNDVVRHEAFRDNQPTTGNDIALVRLPELAITIYENTKSHVLPTCLPWLDQSRGADNRIQVAGWGRLTNDRNSANLQNLGVQSRILQKLTVPLVSDSQCTTQFQSRISPFYLCAGGVRGII